MNWSCPRSPVSATLITEPTRRRAWPRAWLPTLSLVLFLILGTLAHGAAAQGPEAVPANGEDVAVAALFEERRQAVAAARAADDPQALANALAAQAIAYEANDQWPRAVTSWRQALLHRPDEPNWRFHYALCLRETGSQLAALRVLRDLAASHPQLPWVQERFGQALLEQGRAEEAAAVYGQVVELLPDSALAHAGLGEAQLALEAYDAAATSLERAVALAPDYRQAHYLLGLAYRGRGELDAALLELRRGVDARRAFLSDPLTAFVEQANVDAQARREQARQLLAEGQAEEAVPVLEALLASGAAEVGDGNNLAIAYMQVGRFDDAEALLLETAGVGPDNYGTQFNLASLAIRRGDLDQALAYAERAVAVAPKVAKTHVMLASVKARQEDWASAIGHLETAARLDARNPQLAAMHGDALERLGRYDEAAERYARALELAPDHLPAQIALAKLRLRAGDIPAARALHARARALAPGNAEVRAVGQRLSEADAGADSGP